MKHRNATSPRKRLVIPVVLGLFVVAGAMAQESLLNIAPSLPAASVPASSGYSPVAPPAASNPGVLEAPELVARKLNESDAEYTARMTLKRTEVEAETARLLKRHDEVMRAIQMRFGKAPAAGVPTR